MRHASLWLALTALALGGCGKKGAVEESLAPVKGAFGSAGFKLDDFKAADGRNLGATACAAGAMEGVDTLVCTFKDPPIPAAKKGAEDWVGTAVTGTVLVQGTTLLGLADRRHVDPNGKIIHKITQAFRQVK